MALHRISERLEKEGYMLAWVHETGVSITSSELEANLSRNAFDPSARELSPEDETVLDNLLGVKYGQIRKAMQPRGRG